jgi:hypothetical protein
MLIRYIVAGQGGGFLKTPSYQCAIIQSNGAMLVARAASSYSISYCGLASVPSDAGTGLVVRSGDGMRCGAGVLLAAGARGVRVRRAACGASMCRGRRVPGRPARAFRFSTSVWMEIESN